MARKTQVPIALKIKASRVFSLFLRHRQIKFSARRDLALAKPFSKGVNGLDQRRPLFELRMKNPGQLDWPGLMADVMSMPSGFAGERVIVSPCDGSK
ncbi:MAG: hypothetical protein M3R45_12375 [Pseudomonadota bacterium]|nr:hypothetical protein [Pseudomonadota bacterium]